MTSGRPGRAALVGVATGTAVLVTAVVLATSRLQLGSGGPGILGATVVAPALVILAVTTTVAVRTRSFRWGAVAGAVALAAAFVTVAVVVAVEGLVWMDRHGVFVLDGDPPRVAVGTGDVLLDLFTTGMWIGHLVLWLPCVAAGSAIGAAIGTAVDGRGASGRVTATAG